PRAGGCRNAGSYLSPRTVRELGGFGASPRKRSANARGGEPMNPALLSALALLLYLSAGVCYGAVFFLRAPAAPLPAVPKTEVRSVSRFGRPLLLLGIAAQFAAIGAWCITTHRSP